jgi:hypothetical protein
MNIKRYAAASSAAVLLALSLSACGGVDAPEDASQEAFCEAFNSQAEVGEKESAEDQVDVAHDIGDKLEEVGTPDDISDDARKGFEEYVEALKDINEDDVKELSDASEDEAAEALGIDKDAFTAFFEYAFKTCAGDLPTDIPTE